MLSKWEGIRILTQMLNFKKIIVVYWMLWWGIALITDVIGALVQFWLVKLNAEIWDTNYPYLQTSLSIITDIRWLPPLLYAGIIVWMLLITLLFINAVAAIHKPRIVWFPRATKAFILSLGLWLVLTLADQLLLKFKLEENHMIQAAFELLTFLSLYLLPDKW